jgi:hypothetical protein
MYMPGRNFEDTNTHVMDISVMKLVPQHYSVYQNWGGAPPSGLLTTGMATFATSIIPPGLLVNTSAPGDIHSTFSIKQSPLIYAGFTLKYG